MNTNRSKSDSFRHRFPWLGWNLVAGITAAFLAGAYQKELATTVALSFFIPVVLNLAESVASQSVSLSLDLIHDSTPTWTVMKHKLKKEILTGLLLGLGSGFVVGLVSYFWLGNPRVVLCLLGGIAGGVTCSALMGLALPYILKKLGRDPQVAAGPIALACTDIISMLLYLNLARWLL